MYLLIGNVLSLPKAAVGASVICINFELVEPLIYFLAYILSLETAHSSLITHNNSSFKPAGFFLLQNS